MVVQSLGALANLLFVDLSLVVDLFDKSFKIFFKVTVARFGSLSYLVDTLQGSRLSSVSMFGFCICVDLLPRLNFIIVTLRAGN